MSPAAVTVHGFFDFWQQGTASSEQQRLVAYAGTKVLQDQGTATFASIKTGLENSKEPCFSVFKDDLIWSSTSNTDVPLTWNGAEASMPNLGGTPPNFAFHTPHRNRMWAAGVATNASRLYYSASLNHEDWTTADNAGSIDIDPDDGDRIVGLVSHKKELIVFKGPNKLSVHRITGSSPTGSDAFARVPFVTGVGGVNHNSIFRINDDIVFASPRGLHSLAATAAFGDYVEAFLSRPILSQYQDKLNHSILTTIWGTNYQSKGLACWTLPSSTGSVKNQIFMYDYRFQPGRWSFLDSATGYLAAHSLAVVQNSSRKHRLYAGTTTGYIYQLDMAARVIDTTTAYTADYTTPFLNFGTSAHKKNCVFGFMSLLPKGNYNLTFGYTRDTNTETSVAIAQGGVSATLG